MRRLSSTARPFSRITYVEIASWISIFAAAAIAGVLGIVGSGSEGDENVYRWGYATISTIFSPLLAAILVSPFLPRIRHARLKLTSVASLAFLLAILLHISLWGVLASRWLSFYHPRLGSSLWAFILISAPFALALSATYFIKVRAIGRSAIPSGDSYDSVEERPAARSGWRKRWFLVASVLFLVQFVAIAIGAFLTAKSILNDWFTSDVTAWTHGVLVLDMSFLVGALMASALMISRDLMERRMDISTVGGAKLKGHGSDPPRGNPTRSVWLITLGPLFVGCVLLLVSLAALIFSSSIRADYHLNTGIVLFVSYSSSVLPSYAILSFLHLMSARSISGVSARANLRDRATTEN